MRPSQHVITACATLALLTPQADAQNYVRVVIDKRDSLYGEYLAVPPVSNAIRGVLVLIPGWQSSAESTIPETKLPGVAFTNDILTVVVNAGAPLWLDERTSKGISGVLADVVARYKVPASSLVIGGFSAGGAISLRYAEICKQKPASCPMQARAAFSVDSPIDLAGLYESFEREIARNFAPPGVTEAVQAKALLDATLGPLRTNRAKYDALSPFKAQQTSPGNEKYLRTIPVRVYHDIDVQWTIENRRRSLFDTNALAGSDLINALRLQGNAAAEFRMGKTGYRNDGSRHPHSWSIVDEVEFIQWMKRVLSAR